MFLGTHTPKLDEKGRFFLPARFRDELAGGVVITRMQDRALAVYARDVFVQMNNELAASPSSLKEVRDYQRMLAAAASDEIPDKQGRVTIPPHLRRYAGLDKDIVVIGAMNRLEIWDATAWEQYSTDQEPVFADMNGEVLPSS